MSLTVISFIAIFGFLALAAGFGFIATELSDSKRKVLSAVAGLIAALMVAGAIGSLITSISSLNSNSRDTRQSCLDRGGVIYQKDNFTACFKDRPVELQKL